MFEAKSATKGEFIGRKVKYEAVCKFSVSISYAQAVAGQAHILNIKRIIA